MHTLEQIDHVFVQHADATIGHRTADRAARRRAVNAQQRPVEVERALAEWVCRVAAFDRIVTVDRDPLRIDLFGCDKGAAHPEFGLFADGHRIADRLALGGDVVDFALGIHDHHRTGGIVEVGCDTFRFRHRGQCAGEGQQTGYGAGLGDRAGNPVHAYFEHVASPLNNGGAYPEDHSISTSTDHTAEAQR